MSDKDGGHAFPTVFPELAHTEHGQTLRDYFAAKAMYAFCSGYFCPRKLGYDGLAQSCYELADAMLEARKS